MTSEAGSRDGLLVLRLWTEPGLGMRVRITRNTDHGPTPATSYAASKAEVLAVVGQWIEEVMVQLEREVDTELDSNFGNDHGNDHESEVDLRDGESL